MARSPAERRKEYRRSLLLGLVLATSATCGACASGMGGPSSSAGESHPLLGAPAPAFELREVGGAQQSLAAHAGKVVIVDFWATWCQPCKQSFPAYQRLADRLGGALVVLGVSQDDDSQGIGAFRSETGARFPLLWDDGKAVAQSYDPPSMPTAFVVDQSGIVRFVHVGYRAGDEATLEQEVRSLLH